MPAPDAERALRRVRAHPVGRRVLAWLGALALRLVWSTTRWEVAGQARVIELANRGPVLAAFWHGRLIFSPFWAPPGRHTVAMISNNHDGALISEVVGRFGIGSVRGSTADPRKRERDKGGREAFSAALAALAAGSVVAITPDGPRGPRMRAQPGVAALAIAAQVPVVPVAFSTARGRLTRGWDRFLIPLPFDRGVLLYGEPLIPPRGADADAAEAFRAAIETGITALTVEADRRMGREPVDPA